MATMIGNSNQVAIRHLRAFLRQPYFVAITLVQPIIWLLLFGQLFKRVVEIPGFTTGNYISFLTPGVVVMTALFANGWSGMGFIVDMDRGVMNRMLVSPVNRSSIIVGRLASEAVSTLIQGLIIVGLGLIAGARFSGWPVIPVFLFSVLLLGMTFASLSNALALVLRKQESVIAAVQLVILPLTFMSSGFMPADLAAHWIKVVSRYNPVNWAVEIGHEILQASPDWGLIAWRFGLLVILLVAAIWLSTRAFRAYQRAV